MESYEKYGNKIESIIEENREDIIAFIQKLISVPSLCGSEREGEAQYLVREKLNDLPHVALDVWEPDPSEFDVYPLRPIFTDSVTYRGRPNVVGRIRGKGGGRSLILNGHVDVVSAEPLGQWTVDPWSGVIREGKLFGRGAADMKAGVAVIVYVPRILKELGIELKGDLIIQSVVEEECGGGGTLSAVLRGYTADAAIVTEPTGLLNLCIGWSGSRYFKIKIQGKPAVPNRAHQAINAIGLACKCYQALIELHQNRLDRLRGKHLNFEKEGDGIFYGCGQATNLTMGMMKAGDWPATVAGWAELMGRIGFPPSETGHEIERQVEESIRRVADGDQWMSRNRPEVSWYGPRREGDEMSPDEPLVSELSKHIDQVTGARPDLFSGPTTGDITYLFHPVEGYGGIPSVMYGPGGANAHSTDEFVITEEVFQVLRTISHFVIDWCGVV